MELDLDTEYICPNCGGVVRTQYYESNDYENDHAYWGCDNCEQWFSCDDVAQMEELLEAQHE